MKNNGILTKTDKKALIDKARRYDSFKDYVGEQSLANFKFLKSDLSAWYNALTTACFTVGAIAITVGVDQKAIVYPSYFWWGTLLIIFDGVLIFFLKKLDIEGDFNAMPKLSEAKADYWQLRNMTAEKSNGDNTRAAELKTLEEKVTDDYRGIVQKWPWYKWAQRIILASTTDIVFGLLLFPIGLMLTQVINEFNMNIAQFDTVFKIALGIYIIYMILGSVVSIRAVLRTQAADERIRAEVLKKG